MDEFGVIFLNSNDFSSNMNKTIFLPIFAIVVLSLTSVSVVYANPHLGEIQAINLSQGDNTQVFPINNVIALEKSTISLYASPDNSLPWGFVEGKVANPVNGYPVIIQMYQEGEASHFAQVDLNEDGSYEYKFRVLSIDDGQVTRSFEGDYTVIIYKVVYLYDNLAPI